MKFYNLSKQSTKSIKLKTAPVSFNNKTNHKLLKKFSPYFFKNGYKKTFFKNMRLWVQSIYDKSLLTALNYNTEEFFYNINKNKKLKNVNLLFNSLLKNFQLGFNIKCIEVDKRYRKLLKQKYTYEINYLTKQKKNLFFFKNLYLIINKSNHRKLDIKMFKHFNQLIFNFKESEMFKIKLLTLKSLSEKK